MNLAASVLRKCEVPLGIVAVLLFVLGYLSVVVSVLVLARAFLILPWPYPK